MPLTLTLTDITPRVVLENTTSSTVSVNEGHVVTISWEGSQGPKGDPGNITNAFDSSQFNNNLSPSDDTFQKVFNRLDTMDHDYLHDFLTGLT